VFGWAILEMDGASREYLDSSAGNSKEVHHFFAGPADGLAVSLF